MLGYEHAECEMLSAAHAVLLQGFELGGGLAANGNVLFARAAVQRKTNGAEERKKRSKIEWRFGGQCLCWTAPVIWVFSHFSKESPLFLHCHLSIHLLTLP